MTDSSTPRRRSGRKRVERGAEKAGVAQLPFAQPRRSFAPTEVLSADEIESIHEASLVVLSDIGMDFLEPEARGLLADAGAKIEGDRVRFDPEMVMDFVSSAPAEFVLHGRGVDRSITIGGDWVAYGAVASAPNVSDLQGGRRTGNRKDFRGLVRLSQSLNAIHLHGGYPVEPTDVHPSVRHLHCTYDLLTLSDKALHAYSLGRQRNLDCLEMVRIARGITEAELDEQPSIFSVINSSSPLRLDIPMLRGILEYSARNQPIVMTPFTLAGAMAPVTVAGALVQQNAEALAGITMTQLVRRGAPVIYGGFTSNVDMRSGSPAFGTPEYVKAAMIGGQLARRYDVPYRSSNVNASNALDLQAGYESVFALWGAIMGGANLVFHGAGWMEGGLRASFEKMIVDADLLQMVTSMLAPLEVNAASMAHEAMSDVGPGGHFFGTAHTQERYRDAFYSPMLSDWRNFESWEEAGSPTADAKAAELAAKFEADYVAPSIDEARQLELEEFVAKRVEEGGVSTDF